MKEYKTPLCNEGRWSTGENKPPNYCIQTCLDPANDFYQDDLNRAKWDNKVEPEKMQKIITSSYAIGAILSQKDEKQEPILLALLTRLKEIIQSLRNSGECYFG
jgi:hypothetical protein